MCFNVEMYLICCYNYKNEKKDDIVEFFKDLKLEEMCLFIKRILGFMCLH